MLGIDLTHRDRQIVRQPHNPAMFFLIASIVMVGLASCSPPVTNPSPTSPGSALTPKATLIPIASATGRETEIVPTGPLTIVPVTTEGVKLYELVELEIQSEVSPTNPFDPDEFDIQVRFTSATGATVEVGAFWYQDFESIGHKPIGEPGWRVRFTPTEGGDWTAVAYISDLGLESAPVNFHIQPSDGPGFVRIHPQNPRYFAFDNGDFFFPIGLNMAWWSGAGTAQGDYKKWMDLFAANGGNAIRVWMAEWSFGLEWNDTPLGDYSNRLLRAWLLDQIFAMAEERDMYIMLTLLNCADFNNWQTDGWNHNPYNAEQGGPLEQPAEFVSDPTARALLQRRLNYIVNRWGYSPHLLAWEWWNEVDLTPFTDEMLIPWLQEMTAYLRARDVNQHLVTNSYAIRYQSPTWSMPELDIIQKHDYPHQMNTTARDLAERVETDLQRLTTIAPDKPILYGEFGYGNEGYGNEIDKTGIHLHNGIWGTTFGGNAGTGMYWYWDVYVEAYNAWSHFKSLSRFLEDLDLSRYQPFSPLEIHGPYGETGQVFGLGLKGDDILVWLRNADYTVQAVEAAWTAAGSPSNYTYTPPLVSGQVLTLNDMAAGAYTVRWYDPRSTRWMDPVVVTMQGDRLSILIPDFRRDLAARIVQGP
jgi:hypothetical protein